MVQFLLTDFDTNSRQFAVIHVLTFFFAAYFHQPYIPDLDLMRDITLEIVAHSIFLMSTTPCRNLVTKCLQIKNLFRKKPYEALREKLS